MQKIESEDFERSRK